MDKDLLMSLNTQLFADYLDDSAANVDDELDADADSDELVFDESKIGDEKEAVDGKDDTKKANTSLTKEYSDRLNADREKIRKELEEELSLKTKAEKDALARGRGFEDWAEMEEYDNNEKIRELGVEDTSKFNDYIGNVISKNPTVIEANRIIEEHKKQEANRVIEQEIAKISAIDDKITSIQDIMSHPKYDEINEYIKRGSLLSDAYKLVNFDELASKYAGKTEQEVYDKINTKSHLVKTTTTGVDDINVPDDVMKMYRRNLKSWTDEQIKTHYRNSLKG